MKGNDAQFWSFKASVGEPADRLEVSHLSSHLTWTQPGLWTKDHGWYHLDTTDRLEHSTSNHRCSTCSLKEFQQHKPLCGKSVAAKHCGRISNERGYECNAVTRVKKFLTSHFFQCKLTCFYIFYSTETQGQCEPNTQKS